MFASLLDLLKKKTSPGERLRADYQCSELTTAEQGASLIRQVLESPIENLELSIKGHPFTREAFAAELVKTLSPAQMERVKIRSEHEDISGPFWGVEIVLEEGVLESQISPKQPQSLALAVYLLPSSPISLPPSPQSHLSDSDLEDFEAAKSLD
jgi:hypothetical protein